MVYKGYSPITHFKTKQNIDYMPKMCCSFLVDNIVAFIVGTEVEGMALVAPSFIISALHLRGDIGESNGSILLDNAPLAPQ